VLRLSDMGDAVTRILQALDGRQALRKITGSNIGKSGCTVMFINQLRQKIGGVTYDAQKLQTGGNALKFYASVHDWIFAWIQREKGEEFGNRVKVKLHRPPHLPRTEFDVLR